MMHRQTMSAPPVDAKTYIDFFQSQTGKGYPVFVGGTHQYGNGVGDVLKGLFRTMMPVLLPAAGKAAQSMISNTMSGMEEGRSFGESVKHALVPSGAAAFESAVKRMRTDNRGRVYKVRSRKPKPKPKQSRRVIRRNPPISQNRNF